MHEDNRKLGHIPRRKIYAAVAIFLFMFVIQLPASLPSLDAVYRAARNAAIASLMYILNVLGVVKIKKVNGYRILFNYEEEEEEGGGKSGEVPHGKRQG